MLPRYIDIAIDNFIHNTGVYRFYAWGSSCDEMRRIDEAKQRERREAIKALLLRAVSVPMIGHRSYRAWTASGAGRTYGEYIDANRIDIIDDNS